MSDNNFRHGPVDGSEPDPLDELSDTRMQRGMVEPEDDARLVGELQSLENGVTATAPGDEAFGRGEGIGESKEVEGLSQGRIVLRRFLRHRGAVMGMIMFGLTAILAFSSMGLGPIPGWWKHDTTTPYDVQNGGAQTLHLPKWLGGEGWNGLGQFPFGQNMIGQDNFAQVMKGIQTSIMVMVVLAIVALVMGVVIGALAGYYRGRLDNFLMRFTDLIITLPLLVIGSVLGKLITTLPAKYNWPQGVTHVIQSLMPLELAVVLGLVSWPSLARLTRSEFLRLREMEFVDSARVAGASDRRIIFKHMLPNAMGVIIVSVTLLMSASVVLEAVLSFLGFGIYQPAVSLGLLIAQNQAAFNTRPWLFWWPGLFIIILALSVNFIGDGLRDAFDPRTRRIPSQRALDKAARKAEAEAANVETAAAAGGTK